MTGGEDPSEVFGRIYESDHWDGGSGVGSAPDASVAYRAIVELMVRSSDVRRIVDVGCGDWQVGSRIDWTGVHYTGLDVVPGVIRANQNRYGRSGVEFLVADARIADTPPADVLLAKDVLQHWPNSDVAAFLDRTLGRYRYVLLTNDVASSHWPHPVNEDIPIGAWRSLDLEAPPFGKSALWRQDYDVRGEWTKRAVLFASTGARIASLWRSNTALRCLRRHQS